MFVVLDLDIYDKILRFRQGEGQSSLKSKNLKRNMSSFPRVPKKNGLIIIYNIYISFVYLFILQAFTKNLSQLNHYVKY